VNATEYLPIMSSFAGNSSLQQTALGLRLAYEF
jgi:hypothetical protein